VRRGNPIIIALVACAAAASTFLLPAMDIALPGGSITWQVVAVVVALVAAWCAARARSEGGGQPARRLARGLSALAIVIALAWVGGVVLLWFIWPR